MATASVKFPVLDSVDNSSSSHEDDDFEAMPATAVCSDVNSRFRNYCNIKSTEVNGFEKSGT